MNDRLLQSITMRFGDLTKSVRVECHAEEAWQKKGIKILICVDGGRTRERRKKLGRRKKGLKRQGYTAEWFEPRLLTITQFDEAHKRVRIVLEARAC